MDDRTKVLEAMKQAGKALRPGEIATAAGMDKDAAGKIIEALKKEGKIISPKRCFCEPA